MNMLNKKIKHNRIKPKAKKLPKYLKWLHNQNDIVCFVCGKQNKLEAHHVKQTSSDERDDSKILMLCGEECHRNGRILSAHGTPKKFRETFSMQQQFKYAENLHNRYLNEGV